MKLVYSIFTLWLSLAHGADAMAKAKANNNLTVFWGQELVQGTEEPLRTYCQSAAVDTVVISGVTKLKGRPLPVLSLSPAIGCTDQGQGQQCAVKQYPRVSSDIKECQSRGKRVMLALQDPDPGLEHKADAHNIAAALWDMFGVAAPVASSSFAASRQATARPFGNAAVDGFVFDIATTNASQAPLLAEMARVLKLSKQKKQHDKAPVLGAVVNSTCDPGNAKGPVIREALAKTEFDFVHIRTFQRGSTLSKRRAVAVAVDVDAGLDTIHRNMQFWDTFITKESKNKQAQVLLGLPASRNVSKTGYKDPDTAINAANALRAEFCNFGGVALWDAGAAWNNTICGVNYAQVVHDGLVDGIQCPTSVYNAPPLTCPAHGACDDPVVTKIIPVPQIHTSITRVLPPVGTVTLTYVNPVTVVTLTVTVTPHLKSTLATRTSTTTKTTTALPSPSHKPSTTNSSSVIVTATVNTTTTLV